MISTSSVVSTTWFTPTILFCFLNLMIAIIFLTSRKKQSDKIPQIEIGIGGVDSSDQLLRRAPSLLQRVKSINFSFNHSSSDHYSQMNAVDVRPPQITRSKSDSETVVEAPLPPVRERKGKSVETGRYSCSREDEEGVDDKADDFINRFRQQLKLQRLDSILRYKEMLNRGRCFLLPHFSSNTFYLEKLMALKIRFLRIW